MSTHPDPGRAGRLAVWLGSPASAPVLAGVAVASAAGWTAAAGFLIAVTVAGHPLADADPALREPVFLLLAVLDTVVAWSWRLSRPIGPSVPRPPRASRKAARRDRLAARGGAPVWRRARAAVAWTWRPRFPELPGPVGRAVSVAGSLSLAAFLWVYAWPIAHGHFPLPDPAHSLTLPGQQWGTLIWMVQLYAWCRLACVQLNNSRAAQRLWIR